ncbi:Predicted antitoxin, contains HTH domain [Alteribacillus iranensis]|uniref:Predicted antitoxin, contains HTH domain n=2 Tax=Alteribacillus iranensis TaxID=930128 RepID=A0A1I2BPL6_9BACI|nr:Predicted antitoxin, contains HTH domain [Alteribacillus iranensis]
MAMEDSKARVGINPEFLPFLKGKNVHSIDEDVNLSLAIYLFTAKKLTLARAAELCGKSLSDFIQILMDHNIHWAEYTKEHKEQDDETIEWILKEDGRQTK